MCKLETLAFVCGRCSIDSRPRELCREECAPRRAELRPAAALGSSLTKSRTVPFCSESHLGAWRPWGCGPGLWIVVRTCCPVMPTAPMKRDRKLSPHPEVARGGPRRVHFCDHVTICHFLQSGLLLTCQGGAARLFHSFRWGRNLPDHLKMRNLVCVPLTHGGLVRSFSRP